MTQAVIIDLVLLMWNALNGFVLVAASDEFSTLFGLCFCMTPVIITKVFQCENIKVSLALKYKSFNPSFGTF